MAGVTDQGFSRKTQETILAELSDGARERIDPAIRTDAESVMGQILGLLSEPLAELWEVAEEVYRSNDPDAAEGDALDSISAISGTIRDPATRSAAWCDVDVDAGTYPAGTLRAHPVGHPESVFTSVADVVAAVDGTVSGVEFRSAQFGPVAAPAGTLNVIADPVTGWNSVTNPLDADLGRTREADSDLRIKREQELAVAGSATYEAILADVSALEKVTDVRLFVNDTDGTDDNGLPPHSIEVLVDDLADPEADDTIAQAIFLTKAAGIRTVGSVTGTATSPTTGASFGIQFSRAVSVEVEAELVITLDAGANQAVVVASVEVAVANQVDATPIGGTVFLSDLVVAAESVSGVESVDLDTVAVGDTDSGAVVSNYELQPREKAAGDSSRVSVGVVAT